MTTESKTTSTQPQTLFLQYLNVCNQALEAHANDFPYKQLIHAADELSGDRHFGVAVYKDDADAPYDFYTLSMDGGRLRLLTRGKDDPSVTWKVSRNYLERVVADPKPYVDNPAKLDWHWLKSRLGVHV